MMAKKRILSWLVAASLALSLLPAAALAEELDEEIDKEMNGSVYDEVIEAAGEAVSAAEEAVKDAQEKADDAANAAINAATDAAMKEVDAQTGIVDAANGVIDSAAADAKNQADIAAGAKDTVESDSTSMAEKEAAVLIAQDAAEKAAQAAREAQNAWEEASDAVEAAEQAVADAEAEYQRILDQHEHAVDSAEFDAKLQAAKDKMDAAKSDLATKENDRAIAGMKAGNAQTAANLAKDAYVSAEENSGFTGTRIESVTDKENNLLEGEKTLTDKTNDVKTNREELDALGTTDDLQQALNDANGKVTEAQDNLDKFDKSDLDGKDEAQSRKDLSDAQSVLEKLEGQTDELDSKRQKLWDEYTPVNSEWNELDGQIKEWKGKDTPIEGIKFDHPAFSSWNNQTLKEAVDTWKTTGRLSPFAQYAFGYSDYNTRTQAEFMAVVTRCLDNANMPDFTKCDELKQQKDDLYVQWDAARRALENNKTAIGTKQSEIEGLEGLLEKFGELNRLTQALTDAQGEAGKAQTDLDELQGKIDAARANYEDAVKALVEAMGGQGTDYFVDISSKDGHDNLVQDAENLKKAIDALNDHRNAVEAKEKADKAKEEAEKAFDAATAAMAEADNALTAAEKALKKAEENGGCSVKELDQLKADLAAKQVKFNEVKADFDTKEAAKNQADRDAEQAARDAEDARNTLDQIIANLPTGGDDGDTGDDDTTIEDGIVPLAGLIDRQILVSYLYTHEGSPDGVDAEGEYTLALAWAVANDIVDEEDDPEELITVAILRDVMTRYAKLLNRTFDVEIPGEDDDIVMNCDEILAEFFGD